MMEVICLVKRSLRSSTSPRYRTWGFHGMSKRLRQSGRGVVGRRLVNKMASVLCTLTWSFHFEKYRSRADVAWASL